ncbi:hypothetical protein F444_12084 [Phytophthora nicotianae P1976]|uniref:RxLR effector protein n=1 Tax=Phytophthora nicotianae P1976 TaxID=1317066 RepID=A0A080ZY92_PHYNI|nr:hypothetical protein F444_12084 [Phytophthora nicotianae P1976]
MRFHHIILLGFAISGIGADASWSTNLKRIQTQFIFRAEKDVPIKRILRPSAGIEDVQEERAWYSGITKFFKSKTSSKVHPELASKAKTNYLAKVDFESTGDDILDGLIRNKTPLDEAFTNLNLKLGDDLISQPNFKSWYNYMFEHNKNAKHATSWVGFLKKQEYSEEKIRDMLISASKSHNQDVKAMGKSIESDLMKGWTKQKPMKKPEDVAHLSDELAEAYKPIFAKAVEAAKKKRKEEAQELRRRNPAAAAVGG